MAQPLDVPRKIRQLDNDVQSVYEMLAGIAGTQTRHGNRLDELGAQLDAADHRQGAIEARLAGTDQHLTAIDQRLDGLDQRLGAVETRLGGVDGKLDAILVALQDTGAP